MVNLVPMTIPCQQNITGVILAGGRATRLGGKDKGLISLHGKCMIEYIVEILRPQVNQLLVSANRNQSRYEQLCACPVVSDKLAEGPLAGMAACLQVAKTPYVLFVPCDSPLLSAKLVQRLFMALWQREADISVVSDQQRMCPVMSLVKQELWVDLLVFLEAGERKVGQWYQRHNYVQVDFSDEPATFLNINTPEDYAALVKRIHLT